MSHGPDDVVALRVLGEPPEAVAARLREQGFHLDVAEVARLAASLERDPTHAELALLNSMWSEHCSYKSTRALLRTLPTAASNVVLGPGADAGIVRLPAAARLEGGGFKSPCIALAHESHNHPSQLLPYEGAATGIGGIVRDVYCMGAEVVGVLDALRFGDPAGEQGETVRTIARGVVAGVAGYGNALGVPNLGGEVEFGTDFDDNCLVNVVAVGVLEAADLVPSRIGETAAREGWVLVLVGKPTDDSGLGGAAFASVVLDTDEDTQERGAVQLPDPYFKRVLTEANRDVMQRLRARGVAFAMKDLGAAGLGGAASEMAGAFGLELDLDALHVDRPGRPASVLLVAETQERYALAVPEAVVAELLDVYAKDYELGAQVRGAGARVVGRFDASGRFRVRAGGRLEVDLPTAAITEPREVRWPSRRPAPLPATPERHARLRGRVEVRDVAADLETVLTSVHGASRYGVFAHYDSDVQGHTMLRPGDADAGVIVPDPAAPWAVAMGLGSTPHLGRRDAWRAGAMAVCEAVRNVVAVGATPWALTDCLNFGSPEHPEGMQELIDAVRGLGEAAQALGLPGHPGEPLPFVSGNVSLYNASHAGRAIPPTPIVACLGVIDDLARVRGRFLAAPGERVYRIGGAPDGHLGASLYARATGQGDLETEAALPRFVLAEERAAMLAMLELAAQGVGTAAHDIGGGGELVALVEMLWSRSGVPRVGATYAPPQGSADVARAFCETGGYLLAVAESASATVAAVCAKHGVTCELVATTAPTPELVLSAPGGAARRVDLRPLGAAWAAGLDRVFVPQGVES